MRAIIGLAGNKAFVADLVLHLLSREDIASNMSLRDVSLTMDAVALMSATQGVMVPSNCFDTMVQATMDSWLTDDYSALLVITNFRPGDKLPTLTRTLWVASAAEPLPGHDGVPAEYELLLCGSDGPTEATRTRLTNIVTALIPRAG